MKRSKNSKSGAPKRIRTILTPYQIERLNRIDHEYHSELVIPEYPHPAVYEAHLALKHGRPEHAQRLLSLLGDSVPDLKSFTAGGDLLAHLQQDPLDLKGKGGKGGGGNHKPSASPQQVLVVVSQALSGLKPVGMEGNIIIGEFNAEFGNASKALFYASSYKEIMDRHHIIFWSEVDAGFIQTIGKANGHGYKVATGNGRGQASAITVHPRFNFLGSSEYPQITGVQGVQQLRPAMRIDLEDRTTGIKFSVVAVHLKSMRGGPASTAPVRFQQCQILAQVLGNDPVLLAGDFNTFLNNTTDTQALVNAGFKLIYPGDSTSTQQMGGRLDGLFQHNVPQKIGRYQVRAFFKNKTIGRSFSDHALLTWQMYMCAGQDCSGANVPDGSNPEVDTQ